MDTPDLSGTMTAFNRVHVNYVLMDTPDLSGTMTAFNRVLTTDGVAILVFSHPCFDQASASVSPDGQTIYYRWSFPYFEQRRCTDAPWAHFKSEFIWFHRPLSDYFKALTSAGFAVVNFEEPRISEDRYHLVENKTELKNIRPYSVAFKLHKKHKTP